MLQPILGSKDKENILQYLLAKKRGYGSQIAKFFESNPTSVRKQLNFLEQEDVLVGFQVGRIRLYEFNPRYYFLKELEALLMKARECYKPEMREKLLYERIAPRKKGKKYKLKGVSTQKYSTISINKFVKISDEILKNMPMTLLKEGKNVIASSDKISKEFCFMITPELKAYLVKTNDELKKNEIIRELTPKEYEIINIKCFTE